MAWVSPENTADGIIREAAMMRGDNDVAQGRNPDLRLKYFTALNKFMQSLGLSKHWPWLTSESALATKAWQKNYALRSQASMTLTFSGAPTAGQALTVDGTAYTFTSTGAASQADGIAEIISLLNAGTQCFAVQTSATTVEAYWAGDDGIDKVVSDNVTNMTSENFSGSMLNFSRLLSARLYQRYTLARENGTEAFLAGYNEQNGVPASYAIVGGVAPAMRVYASTCGAPDGMYLIQVRYQRMPSAILPDGRGDIDLPVEFHDILPAAIKAILALDSYDEEAVMGDQYIQRRLAELERFDPDSSSIETERRAYDLPTWVLDVRVPT